MNADEDEDTPTNIVSFPEERIREVRTPEGFSEKLLNHKMVFAETVIDDYMSDLYRRLYLSGIDVETTEFLRHYTYVVDSLRAIIYNSIDINHPLIEHIKTYAEDNYEDVDFDLVDVDFEEFE